MFVCRAQHKDHEVARLSSVYGEHVGRLQAELAALRARREQLREVEQQIDANIDQVGVSRPIGATRKVGQT